LADNHYKIDIEACRQLMADEQPELIILGKSMVLYREPVTEVRAIIEDLDMDCLLMYDMAHVLGLTGPNFQEPFKEGADVVTGSTHKTYFGTQRGIIAADCSEDDVKYPFWEAVRRRAFPGSVSNHHLGTQLGLLMAAYEMNHFKDEYQRKVLANARALARALHDCGLDVAGDPADHFTETHQVIVTVGYAKAPMLAQRLEENGIIVNYQALPEEEGFTASGGLRMGVSEMTRFGMEEADFLTVAQLIHDVVVRNSDVRDDVAAFRQRFNEIKFCFSGGEFDNLVEKLHALI
jgi:aminomethyltransferase